ncbi:GntR family transcriptional regulator (plasmid) [Pseudorhodobacter turbinis]|uniref:GntR family transcriptional regulator n=1 Tax=Pseudorhodobacter turbinis TaxID=2500533 RepID=A0A4P8EKI1_9RHOB|nr:GntR family transcriptional regulator [Pseudorhodobacter turbinis]QCO57731.1 GntR family transcriptional regulator [Pseudorhodobacter turbinis]
MTTPDNMPPVDRLNRFSLASAQIYQILRDDIISLSLSPGTVLSRAALQKRFGTSQTPIRDALMRLEEDGLVDVFPQHATKVSRINIGAVQQALFLRTALEREAVHRLSENPPEEMLCALEDCIKRQRYLADQMELAEFSIMDKTFHKIIFEAARISDLWDLVRQRSGHNDRLHKLHLPLEGRSGQIIEDHAGIIDALRRGDSMGAQAAVRAHVSRSTQNIEAIRAKHGDWLID